MTQRATPQTVRAPFDGVALALGERTFRLSREGDKFWAELPDPDAEAELASRGADIDNLRVPTVRRQVIMITGSHHLQHFWVGSRRGGGLFNLPWEYHIAEARWIPMADAHVIPPDEPRGVTHWNSQCIRCHAVNGVPGLDRKTGRWSTNVAELGIACEACHGPAGEHVRHHRDHSNPTRPVAADGSDPTIINPARLSSKRSAEICGQCHSTFHLTDESGQSDFAGFLARGSSYRPGDDLASHARMLSPYKPGSSNRPTAFRSMYWNENDSRGAYWSDGAVRVGGREYLGLLDSACFIKGELSCLSCHSMHDSDPAGQVAEAMDGNRACVQCHTSIGKDARTIEAHTHHPAGSSGSLCYNCHMPHTSFALLRAIRSHRIDSPHAGTGSRFARPNACNLCHLDRTLEWTAGVLDDWYGIERPSLSRDERDTAASVLWLLRGDAAQRVVTAWHMGWKPALDISNPVGWQPAFLATLLDDPYAVVRYVAARSLTRSPLFNDLEFDYIGPAEDRARARRHVLRTWQRHWQDRLAEPIGPLLLKPGAMIDHERYQDLLNRRDDRPVEILE